MYFRNDYMIVYLINTFSCFFKDLLVIVNICSFKYYVDIAYNSVAILFHCGFVY